MVDFLGRVETARVKAEQVRDGRRRVAAIEVDIRQFREKVEPLAQCHDVPLDPADYGMLAQAADDLIRRLEAAQTSYNNREQAREQAEEDRQHLDGRSRRLEAVEQELRSLLLAGGTEDPEEFRRRSRIEEERETLELQRDEHRRSLERLSGPGERYEAFCSELKTADLDRLREESSRLAECRNEIDGRRNTLREERGGIDTELARLTGEEESSALRARRNTLAEQLQEQARQWSRLTIAEALLEKTRQKFERERQPSVVQHAQDFFTRVTGQRYSRLFSSVSEQNGQQSITVIDASGASKQPSELSRGTREQLYLALRFGLIREFGEHAERLPVVVDEALVNFDQGRARPRRGGIRRTVGNEPGPGFHLPSRNCRDVPRCCRGRGGGHQPPTYGINSRTPSAAGFGGVPCKFAGRLQSNAIQWRTLILRQTQDEVPFTCRV